MIFEVLRRTLLLCLVATLMDGSLCVMDGRVNVKRLWFRRVVIAVLAQLTRSQSFSGRMRRSLC